MTALNFLQNSPLIQWAIFLLSASSLVLTLTLAVKTLILPLFSTLTKSQKQNLNVFLQSLNNFLTESLPNLSVALKTILLNRELLPSSKEDPMELQSVSQVDPQLETQADNQILSLLNFIKEYNANEKHK